MQVYEITRQGFTTEYVPQLTYGENVLLGHERHSDDIKIYCDFDDYFPFPILNSWIFVLIQDIHKNLPCGMLQVVVPSCEDEDIITYVVRFEEQEFEKIKKICLTK